ncbi:MAG: DUF2569 domain-containing protein [Chthoniobacterales bacterium]
MATAAGIFFVRASRLAAPLPPAIDAPALSGIGGWLILVAIHQSVRPFAFLWGVLVLYPTVFNLETWRRLTEVGGGAYHPFWAPVLLFELFYNSLAFIFSVFLLALFFKRRAAWPLAYAIFLVFLVAGVGLDVYLTQKIPAAAAGAGKASVEVIRVAILAAVWIPYCFVSKRVKSTFRH